MMRRRARAKPSGMRGVPAGVAALTPTPIGAAVRGWGGTLVDSVVGDVTGVVVGVTAGAVGLGKTMFTGDRQAARSAVVAPPRAKRTPRRSTARRVSTIPPAPEPALDCQPMWSPRAR